VAEEGREWSKVEQKREARGDVGFWDEGAVRERGEV
jgi:hypothetical protein